MEKVIPEFPFYKINQDGQVFSRFRGRGNAVTLSDDWKPIKAVLDKGIGYYLVTLVDGQGKRKNQFIHRLLAQAFLLNPENKAHVNHIDANKQNNSLDNLEWATPKENASHAMRLGLYEPAMAKTRKKVLQFCRNTGNCIAEHASIHEAGRTSGVAWQNISKVLRNLREHAGGYSWVYK